MKNVLLAMVLVLSGSVAFGGDCANGVCQLRSRVVTATREVVRVPVQVTRKTVETTRNTVRRVGSRVRSVVR
jgi:hypothetical protein